MVDQGNDQETAADTLSKIIAGNSALVTNPHLVTALADANATPEQAAAINAYTAGLAAQARVEIAKQAGTKIVLSQTERDALGEMGVDYSTAEFTRADALAAIQQQATKIKAQQDAKKNADDDDDNWWDVIYDHTLGPAFHGLGEAWDWTSSTVVDDIAKPIGENLLGIGGGGQNAGGGNSAPTQAQLLAQKQKRMSDDERLNMVAQGYDPDSFFSRQAYKASGKDVLDLSDLRFKYGSNQVTMALQYADDPEGFVANLANQGTPEEAGKRLAALNGNEAFQNLVATVASRRTSIGNVVTSGIDPLKHPDLKRWTSLAVDVVASFALDPTMVAFGAAKAARLTQLAIDGTDALADAEKVRRVLSGADKGLYASRVKRGMDSFLESNRMIREGYAAGDETLLAQGYAKVRAETPGLAHLVDEFQGTARHVPIIEEGTGKLTGYRAVKADPITDIDGAAEYLSSTIGLIRLRGGVAQSEATLMPGQLSAFGYKKLRGALASSSAGRGVERDKRLVFDWTKDGEAARFLPNEDDAVDFVSGKIVAARDAAHMSETLASKYRFEAQEAKAAERAAFAREKATGKWDPDYQRLQPSRPCSRWNATLSGRCISTGSRCLSRHACSASGVRNWPAPWRVR